MTTQTILLLSVGALLVIDLMITIYTFRTTESEISLLHEEIISNEKRIKRLKDKHTELEIEIKSLKKGNDEDKP